MFLEKQTKKRNQFQSEVQIRALWAFREAARLKQHITLCTDYTKVPSFPSCLNSHMVLIFYVVKTYGNIYMHMCNAQQSVLDLSHFTL